MRPTTAAARGRRISADWQARHHHPLLLLETFVDPERFRGTVRRAANWTPVGETRGCRRRRDGYVAGSTPKRVLLLPLGRDARSLLCAPGWQPNINCMERRR